MSSLQDKIGQTIRGYQIINLIGQGGWGAVYRVYQQAVNRHVAMKMVLPEFANKPEFARRFEQEAQVVAQLQHPHILPLYDYWRDEEGAYFIMQYVSGGNLADHLQEHGALSISRIAKLLSQVSDALSVAHGNNVIHRDLKPGNILLDDRGNAYLTDFGIAKRTDADMNMTNAGTIIGTPAYISPEQLRSDEISPRTDIYALGVMLWELLTGRHPLLGMTGVQMMIKQLTEPLPPLSNLAPDLPESLNQIVQRATAKNPAERFPDVLAFAHEFSLASAAIQPDTSREGLAVATITQITTMVPDDPYRSYLNALYQSIDNYLLKAVISNIPGARILSLESETSAASVTVSAQGISNALPMAFFDMAGIAARDEEEQVTYDNFVDAFDTYKGRILLLGDPGAGKTITLMAMARAAIDRRLKDRSQPLPILAPVATWDSQKQQQFSDWLGSIVPVLKDNIEDLLEKGQALLLLDGLDELGGERDDPQTHKRFDPRLRFIEMLPDNNQVLISCRVLDYEEIGSKIKLNGAVMLRPLTDAQIREYLVSFPDLWNALTQDHELHEMARNPLLLSLFTYAYAGLGDKARELKDFHAGDLRDIIFTTYVERRYQHEARKPNVRMPFTLEELYTVLGKVAMWDTGKMTGTRNILNSWYFAQIVGKDRVQEFIEMGNQLHILRGQGMQVRFIHLLVRDYFAYNYAMSHLNDPKDYAMNLMATNPAHTLGMIGDIRAVDPMLELLSKPDSGIDIKAGIIWALGKIGDKRAFDPLHHIINDPDSPLDHRMSAVFSLGQLGDERAVHIIVRILTDKSEDVSVRSGAAFALGNQGDSRAVPALLQTLYDDERRLRDGAVDALGQLGDSRALLPLIDMLDDNNSAVRGRTARALGQLGDRRAVEPLSRLLDDEEMPPIMWGGMPKRICDIAAEALQEIGTPDALAELEKKFGAASTH